MSDAATTNAIKANTRAIENLARSIDKLTQAMKQSGQRTADTVKQFNEYINQPEDGGTSDET